MPNQRHSLVIIDNDGILFTNFDEFSEPNLLIIYDRLD